jgi:hypothetical protein
MPIPHPVRAMNPEKKIRLNFSLHPSSIVHQKIIPMILGVIIVLTRPTRTEKWKVMGMDQQVMLSKFSEQIQ